MTTPNFNSDVRFYEERLSPFGNQVLKQLLKNRNTNRDYAGNVLRGRGRGGPCNQLAANPNEVSLSLPATRNKMSPTATTTTTTSHPPSGPHFDRSRSQVLDKMSQSDFDEGSPLHHRSNKFLPRGRSSYEALKDTPLSEPRTNNTRNNDSFIGWNDMFDRELLSDAPLSSPLHPSSSAPLGLPVPFPSSTFHKNDPCLEASTESSVREIICNTETAKCATNNSSKRKSIQPKIDAGIKKIKIAKLDLSDKRLQRKQKYTTSVKNWLVDVDPTRPSEEESGAAGGRARAFAAHAGENKGTAKVIQSRLANKRGVMRFGIPKNVGTSRRSTRETKNAPRASDAAEISNSSPVGPITLGSSLQVLRNDEQ